MYKKQDLENKGYFRNKTLLKNIQKAVKFSILIVLKALITFQQQQLRL